jgi:uncharacterized RDD family membrane protein YckC
MSPDAQRPVVILASLRRRLASMLYESLLLLGVIAVGFLVPLVSVGVLFHLTVPGEIELLHMMILLGVYFVWLWRRSGQTLAMQTWQLQVLDRRTGKLPTLSQCLLRYLLAWPSILLTLCGPGLIWALLLDRDGQFLHDRLVGTCVVFNPSRPQEADETSFGQN